MSFLSSQYLLFLACVITIYYIFPKKFQWIWLAIASVGFYAMADIRFLFYVAITVVTTWLGGIFIEHLLDRQKTQLNQTETLTQEKKKEIIARYKMKRKRILLVVLFINFGILFKTNTVYLF